MEVKDARRRYLGRNGRYEAWDLYAGASSTVGQKGGEEAGKPEEGDEKVARQALTQEEATGAVTASMGQEERPRKERRCDQGMVGVLEGLSAILGVERPRRGKVLKG